MRILAVDLSSVFWTIAQSGASAEGNAPRDYSLKDIRETAAGGYDRVVVAVDGDDRDQDWPQAPWRRSIWPTYKDRSERAAHHWALLKDTIAHCEAEGWIVMRSPVSEKGAFEADDVLGSVVAWARKNGHAVDIRTGDSDLGQLVRDNDPPVRLLRKYKGQKMTLDSAGVREWVGVPPHVIASLKAIAGDTGDGYGGKNSPFPDIGEATAIRMLSAAKGDAEQAVAMAIASEELNADGKTVPKWIRVCRERGLGAVKTGLLLARVAVDLPLDFERILSDPVAKAPPSLPSEPQDAEFTEDETRELEYVERGIAEREKHHAARSTALATAEPPRMLLAPRELIQRDREISALIKHSLKNGPPDGVSDYGKIPGCGDKPALFDVGAERLAKVFGIYPRYKILDKVVRLDGERPFVMYMVRCRLYRVGHDNQVGESIATCNSGERTFRKRDGSWPPIEDLINPVYTRSQKRAFVRSVLRATGAQKYLASGFEDLTEAEFGSYPDAPQWENRTK